MTTQFESGTGSRRPAVNSKQLLIPVINARGLRRACQRGMATAEYAVGILAAVALALVLLRVFNDNAFFEMLLKFVLDLLSKVGGSLP